MKNSELDFPTKQQLCDEIDALDRKITGHVDEICLLKEKLSQIIEENIGLSRRAEHFELAIETLEACIQKTVGATPAGELLGIVAICTTTLQKIREEV